MVLLPIHPKMQVCQFTNEFVRKPHYARPQTWILRTIQRLLNSRLFLRESRRGSKNTFYPFCPLEHEADGLSPYRFGLSERIACWQNGALEDGIFQSVNRWLENVAWIAGKWTKASGQTKSDNLIVPYMPYPRDERGMNRKGLPNRFWKKLLCVRTREK